MSLMIMKNLNRDQNYIKERESAQNDMNVSKSAVFLNFLYRMPV